MKENWVYRRGDIYLANLGVPIGSKQGGGKIFDGIGGAA